MTKKFAPYWINTWRLNNEIPSALDGEALLHTSEYEAVAALAQGIDDGFATLYVHTVAVVGEQRLFASILDLEPAARACLTRWRADERQQRAEQTEQRL